MEKGRLARHVFYDVKEMRDFLLSRKFRGYKIFAHNGGHFDYLGIFDNMFLRFGSENVLYAGSRFISAKFDVRKRKGKNETVKFHDSLNVLQSSVEKLGEALGYPKGITPQKFIDGDRSQGITAEDVEYCARDCEIVFKMLAETFAIAGAVKGTIASLAMTSFRKGFMPKAFFIDEAGDLEFRRSYYGGRVEAFRLGNVRAKCYDVNSLYPFAMRDAVIPDFDRLTTIERPSLTAFDHYLDHFEGCATITVTHKRDYFGALPLRHEGKLIFPVGRFTGTWNFNEIRAARDLGLITVEDCRALTFGKRIPSPLRAYVEHFYNERKKAKGARKLILKYFLNSLYGKFGEIHEEKQEYAAAFTAERFNELRRKHGDAVAWRPISSSRDDGYYSVAAENEREAIANHSIFSVASYITSFARCVMLRALYAERARGNTALYMDTDSLFMEKDLDPSLVDPDELGKFKLEEKTILKIHGLKDYEYSENGKTKIRIKGIPKNAVSDGETWKYVQIAGLKSAIRRRLDPGQPVEITKRLKRTYDKRLIVKGAGGETLPLELNEGE